MFVLEHKIEKKRNHWCGMAVRYSARSWFAVGWGTGGLRSLSLRTYEKAEPPASVVDERDKRGSLASTATVEHSYLSGLYSRAQCRNGLYCSTVPKYVLLSAGHCWGAGRRRHSTAQTSSARARSVGPLLLAPAGKQKLQKELAIAATHTIHIRRHGQGHKAIDRCIQFQPAARAGWWCCDLSKWNPHLSFS